jgi:hypothetical protein
LAASSKQLYSFHAFSFFFFFYFQTHPVIWNAAEAFSTLLERNADGTFVEATFNSNIEKRHSKNGQLNSRNDEMNRHIAPLTPQLTDAFTDVAEIYVSYYGGFFVECKSVSYYLICICSIRLFFFSSIFCAR